MTLPCRWNEGGLRDFAGRARFLRRFGLPRRLDAHERVWLTFAGVDASAEVWLNGRLLGHREDAREPFEFEVSALLRERNELAVDVEAVGNGGLWGEVVLEIRALAFLRGVRLAASFEGEKARLHFAGEVVGVSDRPLEFYGILDGATVAYATVQAAEAGRPLQVISEELPPERWRPWAGDAAGLHEVRAELVNGASLWYTFAQPFTFRQQEP
jgi:hypothetical protein